jgi:arginine-tRNA-protein transferase
LKADRSVKILSRFEEGPESCLYLPDREATQQYVVVSRLSPEEYERKMDEGWRKFGAFLFRPVCRECAECRPIRVRVADFVPDRSQRRALRRNSDLRVVARSPIVDPQRIDLYRRYHAAQAQRKGWPAREGDPADYVHNFVRNPVPAVEISVWEGDALRAVVLNDVTPNTVSAVYHFHDPDCAERSLGTFAVLQTFLLAAAIGRPYVYLGYFVGGCGSMAYKARFRPCEVMDSAGQWRLLSTDE